MQAAMSISHIAHKHKQCNIFNLLKNFMIFQNLKEWCVIEKINFLKSFKISKKKRHQLKWTHTLHEVIQYTHVHIQCTCVQVCTYNIHMYNVYTPL